MVLQHTVILHPKFTKITPKRPQITFWYHLVDIFSSLTQQAPDKPLPPHYGQEGQIIKSAKGHKKLRQRAQISGKTQDRPEVSKEILLS